MKKITLIIIAILCAAISFSQERKLQNKPYIDQRRFHYGFLFGFHMQDLEFTNNGYIDPVSGEQWCADADTYSPGFTVGVLGDLRLNNYMSLRIIPTMHFGQKHIAFHELKSGRDSTQNIRSTYISIPVNIKFAGQRFNNYRPYFVTGISPILDLTTKKQKALLMKPFDCQIEIGMGCDIYLPFFKLIPEIKFCFGLLDILQKKRSDLIDESLLKFTNSLDNATSKMIVFTLYFE